MVDPAGSVQMARVPVIGPFLVDASQAVLPGDFGPTATQPEVLEFQAAFAPSAPCRR